MYRAIIATALSALWLIGSNALLVSGTAQAGNTVKSSKSNTSDRGTTVKSSKSNTSDRKGGAKKPGNPPTGIPGGSGY